MMEKSNTGFLGVYKNKPLSFTEVFSLTVPL